MSHDEFNYFQAFAICMIPFLLDKLQYNSHCQGNLPWYSIASSLCYARNAIYLAFFIMICTTFMEKSTFTNILYFFTLLLCLIGAAIFYKNLHYIREKLNSK